MEPNVKCLPGFLLCLALAGFAATARADDVILFADSFSDVKGRTISQTDGKIELDGQAPTRRVLPFMGTSPLAVGKLTILATEDVETTGPDEKPGVLAISLASVPSTATYCGFAYLGGVTSEKALTLKEIAAAPNAENLQRIKLKFRYKAANPLDPAAVGATFGCRLEPLVESSYASRLAFGSIQATDKWKTLETTLGSGQNIENFIKSVTAAAPPGYKIIWSQDGPIKNYQAGDTLLIDDIEISIITP